jgi:hypothetical protein
MTSFGDAFKAARKSGKTTFKFGGKSYHTKTKDEMASTKKAASVPTPTPRPAAEQQGPNKPKPQQDYPRPASAVGIASASSAIGQAVARQTNAPVSPASADAQKPRQSSAGTPQSAGKSTPGATRAAPEAAPQKQGPQPEDQQWFAKKGSAISLGIARRKNAPSK